MISDWSKLGFNVDKCKVLPIMTNNENFTYRLMGSELSVTEQETDTGVLVDNWMKVST